MTTRHDYRQIRDEGHPMEGGITPPPTVAEASPAVAAARLADALGLPLTAWQLEVAAAHLDEARATGSRRALMAVRVIADNIDPDWLDA